MKKNKIQDWELYYKDESIIFEKLPWYYKNLDQDLIESLKNLEIQSGAFLDLGTGPGTQALELAKLGFEVTASDISQTAIEKTKVLTENEDVTVDLIVDDVLNTRLEKKFDYILDRGCFHVFDEEKRPKYIENISKIICENGYLFLKCFSYLELGDRGPYRFSPNQIKEYFKNDFEIITIKDTVYYGTLDPLPKALFSVLRKK